MGFFSQAKDIWDFYMKFYPEHGAPKTPANGVAKQELEENPLYSDFDKSTINEEADPYNSTTT